MSEAAEAAGTAETPRLPIKGMAGKEPGDTSGRGQATSDAEAGASAGKPDQRTGRRTRGQSKASERSRAQAQAQTRARQRHPNQSRWAVSVAQVGSHVGQSLEIDQLFPAPSGIGDEFYGLPAGDGVRVRARFDSIVEGLVFSGTASAHVLGECGRCLTPIDREVTIDLNAFMPFEETGPRSAAKGRGAAEREEVIIAGDEEEDDVIALSPGGDFADIETLLRDGFVQQLPVTPLCRPDCRGLCPQCGIDLNEQPDHAHQAIDFRLAGLAELREKLLAQGQDDKIEGMH